MHARDAPAQRAAKVIVLGDSCVGKTSIILQLSKSQFDPNIEPTIGTAYISTCIETPDGEVPLNIWDTAGQERFKSIIPMYLRGAAAVVLVCAVDAPASFTSLNIWFEMVDQTLSHVDALYLAVNKIDLEPAFDCTDARAWAVAHNCRFYMTSAKCGDSIGVLFRDLARAVAAAMADRMRPTMPITQEIGDIDEEEGMKCC
jgi:Ras-related protein Rab-5C